MKKYILKNTLITISLLLGTTFILTGCNINSLEPIKTNSLEKKTDLNQSRYSDRLSIYSDWKYYVGDPFIDIPKITGMAAHDKVIAMLDAGTFAFNALGNRYFISGNLSERGIISIQSGRVILNLLRLNDYFASTHSLQVASILAGRDGVLPDVQIRAYSVFSESEIESGYLQSKASIPSDPKKREAIRRSIDKKLAFFFANTSRDYPYVVNLSLSITMLNNLTETYRNDFGTYEERREYFHKYMRNNYPNLLESLKRAGDKDTLYVLSVPNQNALKIGLWHTFGIYIHELRDNWILVGGYEPISLDKKNSESMGIASPEYMSCGDFNSDGNYIDNYKSSYSVLGNYDYEGNAFCIMAPSTVKAPVGKTSRSNKKEDWKYITGTSFATPLVASTIKAIALKHGYSYSGKGWAKKYLFSKASILSKNPDGNFEVIHKDPNTPFQKGSVYILNTIDLGDNSSFTNF